MWVGVAIVVLSVIAGARIIGAADDTIEVWSVSSDMAAGQPLTADDLVATQIYFRDPGEADAYLRVSDRLPADARLNRAVGAGSGCRPDRGG